MLEAAASFPAELTSAKRARRFAEETLRAWKAEHWLESVRILVSELVANVVIHAHTGAVVCLALEERVLRIEVADESSTPIVKSTKYSSSDPSGRGLLIVEALADVWGVDHRPGGKTVWFELRADQSVAHHVCRA